MSYRVTEKTT